MTFVIVSPSKPFPTVAFCGWGRAGKDEAGMFLYQNSSMIYHGSLSWVGLPVVAARLKLPQQVAWETRHLRRMEWFEILNEYRKDDPTRLVRDSLRRGDIVVGLRSKDELLACKKQGLMTHTVWIERPGIPPDPTVTYDKGDCDHVVANDGDLPRFFEKIRQWAIEQKIPGVEASLPRPAGLG